MILLVALASGVSAAVSYLSARFVVIPVLQRRGVLDHPSARSSHDQPIARGGGIAVFAGLLAGAIAAICALVITHSGLVPGAETVRYLLPLAAAFLFGVLGLIDDLNSLSAMSRLVTQVILASVFAVAVLMVSGVGIFATAAVIVTILVIVNGTNFMDGLNTLVPVWGAVSSLWLGILATSVDSSLLAVSCLALTAGLIGFLPLNVSPARSFLGDVGSYAIGGFLSVGVWVLWNEGVVASALVAPFVIPMFDVLYTLGLRIYRGENLFTAHRGHIYQRLQSGGLSHEQVSAVHLLATAVCIASAIPALLGSGPYSLVLVLVVWSGAIIVYAFLPSTVSRRRRLERA